MPKSLQLTVEKAGNLAYVTAQIVDGKGFPCFFDSRFISFRAEKCTLLAAGSADPASEETSGRTGRGPGGAGRPLYCVWRKPQNKELPAFRPGGRAG